MDSGIPVSIGDVYVAVAGHNRRRCRAVEGLAAPNGGRLVSLADLHQLVALGVELLDGVDAVVGGQDGIVVSNIETVGPLAKLTLTEAADVGPFPVPHHDRVLSPG